MSFELFPRCCTKMIFTAAGPAILPGLWEAWLPILDFPVFSDFKWRKCTVLNFKFWTALTERCIELGILKTGIFFKNLCSYKYIISDHRGSS